MSDMSDKEAGGAGIYKALRVQNAALRAKLAAAEEALRYAKESFDGYGCDCGTDEPGTCGGCYVTAALRALEGKDG